MPMLALTGGLGIKFNSPIFESTELFHRGVGDTTDVVQTNSGNWNDTPKINFVSTSSEATGTNILYVVTGAGA